MTDDWASNWAFEKIRTASGVVSVSKLSNSIFSIQPLGTPQFVAGVLGEKLVNTTEIEPFFSIDCKPNIVVTIPKEAIWTGPAIDLARSQNSAFGGFGDLLRCLRQDDVSSYRNKEYSFVEDGLSQHTNVRQLTRIYDRVFIVHRWNGDDVTVVLINEYDITAEHVRDARNRYGEFDSVLKTNPNGSITTEAKSAAKSIGASVFKWGQFLGRLNG